MWWIHVVDSSLPATQQLGVETIQDYSRLFKTIAEYCRLFYLAPLPPALPPRETAPRRSLSLSPCTGLYTRTRTRGFAQTGVLVS